MWRERCQQSLDEYNRYSNVGDTLVLQRESLWKGTRDRGSMLGPYGNSGFSVALRDVHDMSRHTRATMFPESRKLPLPFVQRCLKMSF